MLGAVALVASALVLRRFLSGSRAARAPTALPDGCVDLGCLPVPFGGKRPLPRMLSAYLDPSATSFASAVRHVRTRLVLDLVPNGKGVVMFEAGVRADAPHWMASSLALGLAQLARVLLVTRPAEPALDDASRPVDQPGPEGLAARTWVQGMIDLAQWDGITAIDAEIAARWRAEYEWLVFYTNRDSHAAVRRSFEGCALVRIVVPTDDADLSAIVDPGQDRPDTMTLGAMRVCET